MNDFTVCANETPIVRNLDAIVEVQKEISSVDVFHEIVDVDRESHRDGPKESHLVETLDVQRESIRQAAIEKWKFKKNKKSTNNAQVPVIQTPVHEVRHSATLENIDSVVVSNMYNHLAETSSAPQRRKNQKSLVGSAAHRKKTNKVNQIKSLTDGRYRLESIPLAPSQLRSRHDCPHCCAKKIEYETYNLCCLNGDVFLASNDAPPIFKELLEECPRLTESLIKKILTVLEQNPYVKFLKRLRDIPDLETYEIVLKTLPNVDQRVFNQPQVSQIAALW
ncbi:beta-crystallin B3, partial [Striga asiatica]